MDDDQAVAGFAALGNTTRLEIFRTLVRAGERGYPIGGIQERLAIPFSTLAHHLTMLVQAGLITQEKQGRTVICRAHYQAMNALVDYLTENCCSGFPEDRKPGPGTSAQDERARP